MMHVYSSNLGRSYNFVDLQMLLFYGTVHSRYHLGNWLKLIAVHTTVQCADSDWLVYALSSSKIFINSSVLSFDWCKASYQITVFVS